MLAPDAEQLVAQAAGVVFHVLAGLLPAAFASPAQHIWAQPRPIQAVLLRAITNPEMDPLPLSRIPDRKVIPQAMPPRVGVHPEKQIVEVRVDFDCDVEVAAFEAGLEVEGFCGVDGGVHAYEYPGDGGLLVLADLHFLVGIPEPEQFGLRVVVRPVDPPVIVLIAQPLEHLVGGGRPFAQEDHSLRVRAIETGQLVDHLPVKLILEG